MALPTLTWYARDTGTLGYSAVTAWTVNTAKSAGALVRPTAPAVGNERVFVATTGGTTNATTQPTWPTTKGGTVSDGTVVWFECTGQAGVNHDLTNCPNWTAVKANAITAGYVIQNNAGTFLFICTTAGTAGSGSEPTWNTTAGVTTADNTVTWTSIGAVGNFGNWAAPHNRIGNAMALNWSAPGDNIYVGSDHAETQASSITWAGGQGSAVAPISVVCIGTGTVPPTSATTGATASMSSGTFTLRNALVLSGIAVLVTGSGGNIVFGVTNAPPHTIMAESCTFGLGTAVQQITIGTTNSANGALITSFRDCIFTFGNAGQSIRYLYGRSEIINGSFAQTGTVPTTLFTGATSQIDNSTHVVRDSDLSAISNTLAGTVNGIVLIQNCKLNASANSINAGTLKLHNSDSSINYRLTTATDYGTISQSNTVYRVGGASDGSTPLSWQAVSTTGCKVVTPLKLDDIAIWNDTSGSLVTATIRLTSATTLTNADVWTEVEYPGSSTSPLGTADISTRAPVIGATTGLTSDGSTWAGGLGNNYKIALAFTPLMKGVIKVRVYVGKTSATINVDPLIALT